MSIEVKVLGPGCANCEKLYADAKQAVVQFSIPANVTKVKDIKGISAYKVMALPALVIDGEVKAAGRVPSIPEIISWLATAAMKQ